MAWHVIYDSLQPYIVRIETSDGFGTGFLLTYNKTKSVAIFATAHHVVSNAHSWRQPIKVTHHSTGEQIFLAYNERVIIPDLKRDSAVVLVNAGALKLPDNPLGMLAKDKVKKVGVDIGWMGYPAISPANLCFFHGRISAVLESEDGYLIDGVAINGVSGGPVFAELTDDAPQIIGIVSAYYSNRQRGETLPGLLRAQDVTHFHTALEHIKSLDEAREKQEQEAQSQPEAPSAAPAQPEPANDQKPN